MTAIIDKPLKLKVALVLSAAVFAYVVISLLYNPLPVELRPLAGIALVGPTIATFVLSWKQRSSLVAALLVASGILSVIYGVTITDYLRVLVVPGPIFAFMAGILVLVLGIAKSIMMLPVRADKAVTSAR